MSGLGLVPCPLCGGRSGYRLHEGSEYRWWAVRCHECHEQVTECRSDGRTAMGLALPKIWPVADEAWNEAGAYAEGLRLDAERYRWMRTAGAWDSEIGLDQLSEAGPDTFDAAVDRTMAAYAMGAKT